MSEALKQVVTRGSSRKGMRDNTNAYTVLVVTCEGTKLLGIPRYGWEDNIKMFLKEIILEGVDLNCLAWNTDLCRENGNEPSGSVKCREYN
jgi:hypothetical protein